MDVQTIKQKIISGDMTDQEILNLFGGTRAHKPKGNFLKTILKGYIDAYTAPTIWRFTLQAILILLVVTGTVLLSYQGKIDSTITAVFLAFILGFLFGKFK
jgi:hypothetical protein